MYRAVNNPTNANSVHASVIRIPEMQKRKQCKFSLCGEWVMIGNDSMLCYSDFYSRLSLNGHLEFAPSLFTPFVWIYKTDISYNSVPDPKVSVLERVDRVHNEALETYPKTIRTQLKLTLRTASLVSTSGSFGGYPNLLSARKGVTATGNHSAAPIESVFRGLNCIDIFLFSATCCRRS